MKKGGKLRTHGFTVVETLIVLAVTSALFIVAVAFVNGRQNKTQFMTAINGMQQQLQQIINETVSGYFPSNGNFRCTATGTAQPNITYLGGGNQQGTNAGCIFLGKAVQFGVHGSGPEQYITYTVAGNGNPQVTQIKGATGANPIVVDSLDQISELSGGLTTKAMYYGNNPSNNTTAVAFLTGDASGTFVPTDSSGNVVSGSQQMSLYAVPGTTVHQETQGQMGTLLSQPGAAQYKQVNSVEICFAGGNNQSGLITIGGNSSATSATSQLTVTLDTAGGRPC